MKGPKWPLLVFFSGIGLGYMLVEISQMERLMIFLGHPSYGLSVVLFTLLLSSGLGSYTTDKLDCSSRTYHVEAGLMLLLLLMIAAFGKLTPYVIRAFQASETPVRIMVAAAILCPLGFLMGMPFPMGIKLASRESSDITPALWAVNGAGSVFASVLAIVIALGAGISASLWTGFICYVVSALAFLHRFRRS